MNRSNVLNHANPFEKYFEEISHIPRCSKNEMAISNYLINFAKEHGLTYYQDEVYNVIIYKPASSGYEHVPTVILQDHMDMVCEKDNDCEHDFDKDPLDLYLEGPEGNILRARGTTLGADDGMGVAQMLAILANYTSPHPALECVFTVEEEVGMNGAAALDYSKLSGTRMIALDSGQEENPIIASCGGTCLEIYKEINRHPLQGKIFSFKINGLISGHSGEAVNNDRGNALKLAARLLCELMCNDLDFNLVSIAGGTLHNVVPKECRVVLACSNEQVAKITATVACLAEEIKKEYKFSEPDVDIKQINVKSASDMLSKEDSKAIVSLLNILPNDIYRRNIEHDVVAASNCVAVIKTVQDKVKILVSLRAQLESMLDDLQHKIDLSARACGFLVEVITRYPCWIHTGRSPMWVRLDELMQRMWGKALRGRLVHGGVECMALFPTIKYLTV